MWEYEFLKLRKQINKDIKDLNKTTLAMIKNDINPVNKIKLQIVTEPIRIEVKPIKKLRLIIINDTK